METILRHSGSANTFGEKYNGKIFVASMASNSMSSTVSTHFGGQNPPTLTGLQR